MKLPLGAVLAGLALFALGSGAMAHDGTIPGQIELSIGQQYDNPTLHEDAAPWKGWLSFSVTNIGTEAWGDFHIQFSGMGDISSLGFLQGEGFDPSSSQSGLSWVIDNESVPARIDLYFYGDPVAPGQSASFSVYTDNPGQLAFFGVCMWPTPVPEPAALVLLGLGGLFLRRR